MFRGMRAGLEAPLITDAQALAAVPPAGWLHEYVKHATKQTTAPICYHVAVGLCCLAVTTPTDYRSRYAGPLHANLYALLVGRSGEDQKSSALGVGRRLLYAADSSLIGKIPGSWEGLIDALSDQPRQMLIWSEFGDLLARSQNPGYFAPMKTTLTDLWDCLDDETTVLTPAGWRGIDHVGRFDRVAAWDREANRIVWQAPTAQRARPLRAGERMIAFRNGVIDLRVSEGHRIYYGAGKGPAMPAAEHQHSATAGELTARRGALRLPLSAGGMEPAEPIALDPEHLQLLGWALALGQVHALSPHLLRVACPRSARAPHLLRLCLAHGWALAAEQKTARAHVLHLRLDGDGELGAYLRAVLDPATRFAALQRLDRAQLDAVLVGAFDAAGTDGRYVRLAAPVADDLAAVATLRGLHATTTRRALASLLLVRPRATVSPEPGNAQSAAFAEVPSRPGEQVWCLTVPAGTLVVRRGGKVALVGNCSPQERVKAKNAKTGPTSIEVPNPRLSVMGGCSIPYLEQHTNIQDWTGGFLGRFLFMYGQRERIDPDPEGDDTMLAPLAQHLAARAAQTDAQPCRGLSPAAKQMWSDWFYALDKRPIPDFIAGAKTRIPTMARKIAMLLAWDFGTSLQGTPWHIGEVELAWALRIAELHLYSVVCLAERIAEHPEARLRRDVLNQINVGEYRSLSDLLRRTKITQRKLKEVLEGLTTDGSLTQHVVPAEIGGPSCVVFVRHA